MNPYDTLEVPKDATPEQVKRAYRRKASKTHPDRGGDKDQFLSVQLAYEILSDPKRRERFDRTGQDAGNRNTANEVQATLAKIAVGVVEQVYSVDTVDVVERIRSKIRSVIHQAKMEAEEIRRIQRSRSAKFQKAMKRTKSKSGHSVLQQVFNFEAMRSEAVASEHDDRVELGNAMLELLEEYTYDVDDRKYKDQTDQWWTPTMKFTP